HGGGNRGAATDELLTQLYVDDALTLREIAARLSVTSTYVSRRVRELRLTRRPGRFGSRVGGDRTDLRDKAAELYEQGSNLLQVAAQLGVSSSTVTKVLHEAQVPMRRPGYRSREQPPRTLVDDLYGDPAIAACLRRFAVRRPGVDTWNPATPWESYAPLPLDPDLVRELYVEIGLSAQHVAMLCGLGVTAVRNRMADAGIATRPRSQPCPWSQRRSGA
ncbi:MAG: winged helix-turn-helix domain-containing protein, partial [Acidimicrobiales bacterium]